MRIAINAIATRRGGGLQYVENLLASLSVIGADHTYLVIVPSAREGLALSNPSVRFLPYAMPTLAYRLWWEQTRLPALLRRHGVDVLLATNNIGLLRGTTPFVLTIQNVDPLVGWRRATPFAFQTRNAVLGLMTVVSAKRARRIIASSNFAAKLLRGRVKGAAIDVIPFGRPVDGHDSSASPSGIVGGTAKTIRPYLLAVSSIKYNKNYPRLIEAFAGAGVHEIDLVIVGEVEHPWEYRLMEEAIVRHDLRNRVHMVGHADHLTVRGLYEGALALVFPSLLESFGLPALEAMTYGVPVIASEIEPLREVCGSAAVFVDPTSTQALAVAMRQTVADADLRRRLIEAGREQSKKFSWIDHARTTLRILEAAGR